jgi:hypothetical protein
MPDFFWFFFCCCSISRSSVVLALISSFQQASKQRLGSQPKYTHTHTHTHSVSLSLCAYLCLCLSVSYYTTTSWGHTQQQLGACTKAFPLLFFFFFRNQIFPELLQLLFNPQLNSTSPSISTSIIIHLGFLLSFLYLLPCCDKCRSAGGAPKSRARRSRSNSSRSNGRREREREREREGERRSSSTGARAGSGRTKLFHGRPGWPGPRPRVPGPGREVGRAGECGTRCQVTGTTSSGCQVPTHPLNNGPGTRAP